MKILINNKFVDKKDAKVSIFSTAFMYGHGVFETLRTYGDKVPFKPKEHINRLFNSAKKLNFKIRYNKSQITKMLTKVCNASPHKLQRIKIIATTEALIIISIKLIEDPKVYQGVSCKTIQCHRPIPEAKSLAYLDSYLSHEKATAAGHCEAILIDEKGEVYEGAYSNIFWFEGNTLCTRKDKVLEGITRQTVLELSPFKIKFKTINIKDLLKKQEIFLTQTTKGIVPITKINNKKIGTGKPVKNTEELMSLFSFL